MANGSALATLHQAAGAIMLSSNFLVHRPIMVVSPFRRHHLTFQLKRRKNAKHSLSKVEKAFFANFNKTQILNVNMKYIFPVKFALTASLKNGRHGVARAGEPVAGRP
ncbi:MAG: hypothetical protein AB7P20_03355 [Rhizobiaceae bacterium]